MKGKILSIKLLSNSFMLSLMSAFLVAIYSIPMYADSGNYGNIISKAESFALKVNVRS